jgi:hypothetical protein
MARSSCGARRRLPTSTLGALALAMSAAGGEAAWGQAASGASPQNLEQMRAELQALQAEETAARAAEARRAQRIDALARQLGVQTGAPPVETIAAGETQAASGGGGKRSSLEIYGFAQTDYIQDFKRVDQNWDATLRPSRIPTTKGVFGSDGQSIISVRQSRFGAKASLDVAGQPLNVKFEFDLFGTGVDAGQTTFRLRHAYGSWGPLLAGQTNSNWMDIDTFPNVVDYWGPNGMVFVRTPQIRYTYKTGAHEIAVALEHATNDIDPGNIRLFDPALGSAIRNDEKFPDITAHYRFDGGFGHVQLAGIVRRVGFDTPGGPDNEPKGHKTGWGVNLTSSLNTWRKDKLQLGFVYGEGIATYMNDGGTDLGPKASLVPAAPGALAPTLALAPDVLPLWGLMVYYDHYWSDRWASSIGYSQTRVDNLNFQAADAFRLGQYASANLLWTPDPRLLMGAEFLWGERKDKGGSVGDDTRLQFTFKYNFSSNDLLP